MIQNIIVGIIGILVLLYVAKKIITSFKPNKKKSSCGCCSGCESAKLQNQSDAPCTPLNREEQKK